MSQHKFRTKTKDGLFVEVMMGWDRPTQEFHCVVSPLEDTALGDSIYCNLDDEGNVNGQSLVYFIEVLTERFGITLPNDLIANVYDDKTHNRLRPAVHY